MSMLFKLGLCVGFFLSLSACDHSRPKTSSSNQASSSSVQNTFATPDALGKALFFDKNLSKNRTQACASCHQPEFAFMDARLDAQGKVAAFSLGDDGLSTGDRNTPSITYAKFTPQFAWGKHKRYNSQQPDYQGYQGGFFWDGRAATLADQAAGPFLNPIEMAMPNAAAVIERITAHPPYMIALKAFYGEAILHNTDQTYSAVTQAIAQYENTAEFNSFNSKYDRSLKGTYFYDPLSKESQGKALFFSQQFTNCATCHQLKPNSSAQETFSNYEFHNIGVPPNTFDRQMLSNPLDFVDAGLLDNKQIQSSSNSQSYRAQFKVPSLRNIAVTAPYMHNGVFKELRTVIEFYQSFLEGSQHLLNPETGKPWDKAQNTANLAEQELKDGKNLKDDEIEALICFLRSLTDAQYEHLLPKDQLGCESI